MAKYSFDQIAINSTTKKKPAVEDKYTYIGLEHLDTECLEVTRWGSEVDITGDKLVMKKGDVLFGRRNTYLRRAAIAPHDGIFSAHGMVLRPRTEVVLPEFFPFFIASDYFMNEAIKISVGSLSPTVNWKDLAKLEFDIPSLSEQKRLAEVLLSIEDTLQAYKKLLAETDNMVKARFIEMFGNPEDNPFGWPIKTFSEVAMIDGKMTTDYEKYADYPHIGIDSIEKETGVLSGYRTVREDNVISSKYVFGPSHILYSKIRPVLNKVALPSFEGLCSADCYPILVEDSICRKKFFAHVMRSDFFLRYVLSLSARSQMPKVNRSQLSGFKFPCPPLEKQDEYVLFIDQSDRSKLALKDSIAALEATKKSIMRDAFGC